MKAWKEEKEKDKISFKEIFEQQQMESKVRMEKKVIKVLKTNENIVRDAAEKKKNVMIYGLKEKVLPMRTKREKEETKCIKEILKHDDDEDKNTKFEEVEEVMRWC